MHQTQTHALTNVRALNNLIETAKNGENGFRVAGEDCSDAKLKQVLLEFSREREGFARELQGFVHRDADSGEEAEDEGTLGGAIHRGWINLRSAIATRDDLAVLEECERGEEYAVKQYQDALQVADLGPAAQTVKRQYDQVLRTHQQVKTLRAQEEGLHN